MSFNRAFLLSAVAVSILGVALIGLPWLTPPTSTFSATSSLPDAITRLTNSSGQALRPAWSPDNHLIAFESNRDGPFQIYVMNADGSHRRTLTDGANDHRRPVWTPDGKSILYDSFDGVHQDIWLVNIADGSRKQLTRVDGLADFATMSPDGQQIVFYRYKAMTLNLWMARGDGNDAKPLTRDLADARRNEPTMSWHQPAWSADSQWLAYTGGSGRSIWLMRRDGSPARVIIDDGETNRFPWFLSDGRLAFITEYVPPRYDGAWTNAWAYDLHTQQRTLLREHMSMQEPVAWSADSSKLLFASPRHGGYFNIYLIDLNAPGGLAALQSQSETVTVTEGPMNSRAACMRILLVDDHFAVRRGLRHLLESYADMQVVGEAPGDRSALDLAKRLAPDVLVLDVSLQGGSGAQLTKQLRLIVPCARLIMLTSDDTESIGQLIDGSAHGYLLKREADESLGKAIRVVYHGEG